MLAAVEEAVPPVGVPVQGVKYFTTKCGASVPEVSPLIVYTPVPDVSINPSVIEETGR